MNYEYKTELLKESEQVVSDLLLLQAEIMVASSLDFITGAMHRRKIANKFFIEHSGEKKEIDYVNDFFITSIVDEFKIPVRLYEVNTISEKIILFAHGGGWVQGNLETHDYLCRKMANELQVNVLSIDYRLSPEHQFPTPLNDVLSSYLWASKRYKNVWLSGDSAGGNLCAAACLKLQKLKRKKPTSLLLFYPVLGADFQTESYKRYGHLAPLPQLGMVYFVSQYTGQFHTQISKITNKYISPILEEDVSVFPDTMIVSAGCDVLLTHQIQFANKMNNKCEHLILDGAIHGFMTYGREFEQINTNVFKSIYTWINKT